MPFSPLIRLFWIDLFWIGLFLSDTMTLNRDDLQALRNCCRDEAAFEQLQVLLATRGFLTLEELPAVMGEDWGDQRVDEPPPIALCQAELQELRRFQEVVLHTMAHDLKTSVLGTLMVFQQLLAQTGDCVTLSRSLAERIAQGSECQLHWISTFLDAHSCPQSKGFIHCEWLAFGPFLDAIAQSLQPLLSQHQAQLTCITPPDLPCLLADPHQLQRVFEHLLLVLLQHNPPGLQLTLTAQVDCHQLRCTLQDHGQGLGPLECQRLFSLSVRDPQSRCSTSLGLKLYLCQKIIHAHGGDLGVTSCDRQGTTLWLTLPLAPQAVSMPV